MSIALAQMSRARRRRRTVVAGDSSRSAAKHVACRSRTTIDAFGAYDAVAVGVAVTIAGPHPRPSRKAPQTRAFALPRVPGVLVQRIPSNTLELCGKDVSLDPKHECVGVDAVALFRERSELVGTFARWDLE